MLLILPILALLCALSFILVLGRPRYLRGDRRRWDAENLSIIIPARNEEGKLGGLLDTIRTQDMEVGEVIVVDDGSKDRTAQIAKDHGASVLQAGELPEGWKGKPWACQRGGEAAKGEWLLFLDADTRFEAGGLEKLMGLTEDASQVYSVCPYHTIRSLVEELSAFFNVLMVAGSGAFGKRPADGEALFGQCLLISRAHYEAVGGHGSVQGEVLENFHLAGKLQELGVERCSFLGRGAVRMRMFGGGFLELWRSWQKGFTAGAQSAPRTALVGSSVWIFGAMLALVVAILGLLPGLGVPFQLAAALAYAVFVAQCSIAFSLVGNFSVVNALFFPVSLLFYQVLFFTALVKRKLGRTTEWKGRHVD